MKHLLTENYIQGREKEGVPKYHSQWEAEANDWESHIQV